MEPKHCNIKKNFQEVNQTVDLLKVVAEENRLKILCFLEKGEQCVCDIGEFLNLPQNLVSYHLKTLKDVGLVKYRKEGLKIYYFIDKKEMSKFNSSINKFLKIYE